jgi:hypothetical protein
VRKYSRGSPSNIDDFLGYCTMCIIFTYNYCLSLFNDKKQIVHTHKVVEQKHTGDECDRYHPICFYFVLFRQQFPFIFKKQKPIRIFGFLLLLFFFSCMP